MTSKWNLLALGLILYAAPGHAVNTSAADTAGSSSAPASVDLADLRCEYLQDPLGIDVRQPRLSWRLAAKDAAARGLRQTAYRVLVGSSLDRLAKDEGDRWDSGDVASSQSVHVVYAGSPLASRVECFWKVRVRDQDGKLSAWSQPARWSMGLLEPGDWQASWIGADAVFVRRPGWPIPDNTMPDPWFRKPFTLDAAPARAMLYVASIGYHEVYVNGRKVGDTLLAPPPRTTRSGPATAPMTSPSTCTPAPTCSAYGWAPPGRSSRPTAATTGPPAPSCWRRPRSSCPGLPRARMPMLRKAASRSPLVVQASRLHFWAGGTPAPQAAPRSALVVQASRLHFWAGGTPAPQAASRSALVVQASRLHFWAGGTPAPQAA